MSKKTFKGGIHPLYSKQLTQSHPIVELKDPPKVFIPLIQHVGAPCEAVVKTGDDVKAGTLIGVSEKFISSKIHSSISGKVKGLKKSAHPVLGTYDALIIENDGLAKRENFAESNLDIEKLMPDEIVDLVKEAGLVGLGGAAFPTNVKLVPPKEKSVDTFILNGAECEPYLTCDDRLMIEHSAGILKGMLLIMKAVNVSKGIIAIEDNKPEAIKSMSKALNDIRYATYDIRIEILRTKYPQGGEKQLIAALLNREVPPKGLPFDVGCLVGNVQTAYAVYEAVYMSKPLYERVITVTGDAIKEPSNLRVKIGTPLSYVIDNCGGLSKELAKIIIGGPMMGISHYNIDVPIIKGTSGFVLLSKDSVSVKAADYCIRCGKCASVCPVNLVPTALARAAELERADLLDEFCIADCMECGSCAYECPSNIPLVQLIRYGKRQLIN
ncbi:MAG: electron transport complex subunit RsxC [Candidatus Omnitrophota bacterium]